jgi:hypothetical protein
MHDAVARASAGRGPLGRVAQALFMPDNFSLLGQIRQQVAANQSIGAQKAAANRRLDARDIAMGDVLDASAHPDAARAIGHAVLGALRAINNAPGHAAHWWWNQEHRDNRHWALQESLNELAGRQHSSAWAWDMENPQGPFQRDRVRHLIHPLGG